MNHVVDKNLNPPDYTREEVFDWIKSAYNQMCDVQSLGWHVFSDCEWEDLDIILNILEHLLEERED